MLQATMANTQSECIDAEHMTQPPAISLSDYASNLKPAAKTRYIEKLQYDNSTSSLPDPFTLTSGWSDQPALWPDITFGDIYTYLIDTPGKFTHQNLKAHKSLKAYE